MALVMDGDINDLIELVNVPEVHPSLKLRSLFLWEPPRGRWFAGRVPRPSPTGWAPTKRFAGGLGCISA
jgi:hypothetical protein